MPLLTDTNWGSESSKALMLTQVKDSFYSVYASFYSIARHAASPSSRPNEGSRMVSAKILDM